MMDIIRLGVIDGIFADGKVRVAFPNKNTASGIIPLYSLCADAKTPGIGDSAAVVKTASGDICVPIDRVKTDGELAR